MTKSNPVRWLTAEEQTAWRTYLRATAMLDSQLGQDLKPFGLDLAEYEVLVALSEAPARELRMSELAEFVHQSRSRLTHTVARMERQNFVTRTADPLDKRGVRARLTDEGFKLLVEAAPAHVKSVRKYLVDAMPPEVYQTLGQAMAAVEAACTQE